MSARVVFNIKKAWATVPGGGAKSSHDCLQHAAHDAHRIASRNDKVEHRHGEQGVNGESAENRNDIKKKNLAKKGNFVIFKLGNVKKIS